MAPERTNLVHGNQLKNASNVFASPLTQVNTPSFQQPQINPPPLPPRQQSYSSYNAPFGSNFYNNYNYGSQYRGYSNYGGYGGFGNPYSNYNSYGNYSGFGGHSGDVENRFFQYAEESTRSTFKLVETVLQTFSSMTMMLESTYFALTNSFRAILSVAENIGRLRSSISQLFNTFALIRILKWLYRKLTRTANFQGRNLSEDKLWEKSLAKIGAETTGNSSVWTGTLMFTVFFLIPYVIHKISSNIKTLETKGKDPKEWCSCSEPTYVATALFDFTAANPEELSMKAGQKMWLAPQPLQPKAQPGWCRASDGSNVGLIPYNYVKVIGQLKKKHKDEMAEEKQRNLDKKADSNDIESL